MAKSYEGRFIVAVAAHIAEVELRDVIRWLSGARPLLQTNLVLALKYDLKGFLILCNPPVNADSVSGKFS